MKITSPNLFGISVVMLLVAGFQLNLSNTAATANATRDFDFGSSFMIILAFIQVGLSLLGVALSFGRSTPKSKP